MVSTEYCLIEVPNCPVLSTEMSRSVPKCPVPSTEMSKSVPKCPGTEMSRILLHTSYCLDLVTSDIYVILKHHSLVYIYMYSANGDPYN